MSHNKITSGLYRKALGVALPIVLLIGVGVVAVAGVSYWFFACPCDRIPGAYLTGEVQVEPVEDWTFINEIPLCQIQVRSGILPHAVNLNCFASSAGELYISCAQCEGKSWSSAALENPNGRLRANGLVYPVTLTRAPEQQAWTARMVKFPPDGLEVANAVPTSATPPEGWWSFHAEYRSN